MKVKEFWYEHQPDGTVDMILQLEQGTGYRLKNVQPLNWEPGPIAEGDASEVILEAVNLKYQPLKAPESAIFSAEMDDSFNEWVRDVHDKMGSPQMPAPMVAKIERLTIIERAVMSACEWDGAARMFEGEAEIEFMDLDKKPGNRIVMTATKDQFLRYKECIYAQFHPTDPDKPLPQSNRPLAPPPTLVVKYRTTDEGKHRLVDLQEDQ